MKSVLAINPRRNKNIRVLSFESHHKLRGTKVTYR